MEISDELIQAAAESHGVEIVASLRNGGQKAVRRVRRGADDLVLKVIAVSDSSPDDLRRAEREVELLETLDSPHVVKVRSELIELGDPAGGACWLEEHIEGDDLGDLLAESWTWSDTARMMNDAASGLGAAHERRVIHRDLSAHNVRRRTDGSWVVLDFGFARHTLRSGLTVYGHPGTPGFMTPEHLHGYSGGPNPASDVFGVGILAYLSLTGVLPISTGGGEDYLTRLLKCEVQPVLGLRPDLSIPASEIVMRCLHPQNARRYRNGQRLSEVLEAAS